MLILVCVLGTGAWLYRSETERYKTRGTYGTIITRDVVKFADMLDEKLGEVQKGVTSLTDSCATSHKQEIVFHLDAMTDVVERMRKYLSQEVGKMKK